MSDALFWELVQNNSEHIGTLNDEFGEIAQRMAVVETKVETIEMLSWGVIMLVISLVVKSLWEVIQNKKSNK